MSWAHLVVVILTGFIFFSLMWKILFGSEKNKNWTDERNHSYVIAKGVFRGAGFAMVAGLIFIIVNGVQIFVGFDQKATMGLLIGVAVFLVGYAFRYIAKRGIKWEEQRPD